MGPERITDLAAKCKLFGYLSLKEYDVERCVSCIYTLSDGSNWMDTVKREKQ